MKHEEQTACISVIVPVYNVENTLRRCIDSILAQTYALLDIVLVDDGSTDKSGVICDEYATMDERIVVIHQINGGLSSARNAGLTHAKGTHIGFVDSDDFIDPHMYESLLMQMQIDDSDIAICEHYTVQETTEHRKILLPCTVLDETQIQQWLILPLIAPIDEHRFEGFVCRNLYRATLFETQRFASERQYYAEDVVLHLSMYQRVKKISIVHRPLYDYCLNTASLTNTYREHLWETLENFLSYKKSVLMDMGLFEIEKQRWYRAVISMMLLAMYNVNKPLCPLTKKEKKDAFLQICQSDAVRQCLAKVDTKALPPKYRCFVLLFRCKQYGVLSWLLTKNGGGKQ